MLALEYASDNVGVRCPSGISRGILYTNAPCALTSQLEGKYPTELPDTIGSDGNVRSLGAVGGVSFDSSIVSSAAILSIARMLIAGEAPSDDIVTVAVTTADRESFFTILMIINDLHCSAVKTQT